MPNPILCIIFPIHLDALDVYILILLVKVGSAYCRSLVGYLVRNIEAFEERRSDEVDILSWLFLMLVEIRPIRSQHIRWGKVLSC